MAKRKCFVTHNSVTREVFPFGLDKQKYVDEREKDQIFFRRKLGSKLTFINAPDEAIDDFDYFSNIEETGTCAHILIEFKVLCNGRYVSEWNGVFSTGKGGFNYDACTFTVLPEPDDKYRCIFDSWNTKYNFLDDNVFNQQETFDFTPTINVEVCSSTGYQCGFAYRPCPAYASAQDMFDDGWCVQSHIFAHAGMSHCGSCGPFQDCYLVTTGWIRQTITLPCAMGNCPPAPPGWMLITDDCSGSGLCTYASCPTTGANVPPLRGVLLSDVVENALSALSCSMEFSSIFLDKNPDTSDPHYSAGINYVTGSTNKVNNLMISQASDVINPTSSDPATIAEVTLKMILEWYRTVFNCYWDVVERNGDLFLIVEHVSFYSAAQTLDLTQNTYEQYVNHKNAYEHNRDNIPQFEKFKWHQVGEGRLDFVGRDIIYALPCATTDLEVTYTAEKLSTDLLYLVNSTEATKEGFVLTNLVQIGTDYFIDGENAMITGTFYINGHLCWANLHFNYHRHNRFLLAGNMNGNNIPFLSARPNIKQVVLSIPACCLTVDPSGTVKTELGHDILGATGFIQRMELDFKTDILSLILEYHRT